MTKKNPKVSFVIRTKNEERYIGKVLRFIYKQTFKDFEVIIVDSGSNDRTLKTVKKFPVRLIKIKPDEFNFSYALNLGISKAKGKYICIISGHSLPISDTWLKDGLSNFKNPKVAGVTGGYTILPFGYLSRTLGRIVEKVLFFVKDNEDNKWLTNTNTIIRKDLWRVYPFDENLESSEDYDWAVEMIARGYKVVKDLRFKVFHSHFMIGRPGWALTMPTWKKWNRIIENKKRPSKSFSKVK